jgi:hypothetical protein
MAQANSFSHIGAACVRVLARQAAINAVKSELQRTFNQLRGTQR